MRKVELSRALKHSDLLRAVRAGAPLRELEDIKADLDALTELGRAVLDCVLDDIRFGRAQQTPVQSGQD